MNMWLHSVHTLIQAKLDKIAKYEQKARDLVVHHVSILPDFVWLSLSTQADEMVVLSWFDFEVAGMFLEQV